MISMPELEIIKELTELIEEEYSAYLLITEEEMPDIGHLPPLRFVGTKQNLPKTMTGPHLLIELEKAEPTVKDRIIKQTAYSINLELKKTPENNLYFYLLALKSLLDNDKYQIEKVDYEKGRIELVVKNPLNI